MDRFSLVAAKLGSEKIFQKISDYNNNVVMQDPGTRRGKEIEEGQEESQKRQLNIPKFQ